MANQITLAFSVATASMIYTPAQAAAKLAAVPLYTSPGNDVVLGQLGGLTVSLDVVSTGGVTYKNEVGGPFLPGETVEDSNTHKAIVALDENGMLFFVEGSATGVFVSGHTITGQSSGATATVVNAAAPGGPTSTTPGATRVIVLNMTSVSLGAPPYAPPPFPCRPTGPLVPPPAAPPVLANAALAYYGATGSFVAGDVVTGGTSGATATVARVISNSTTAGTLLLSSSTAIGAFQAGEGLTGSISGATAKAASLDYSTETGLFAVGDTVTGTTSTATGLVSAVADNGDGTGTLIFSATTGVFEPSSAPESLTGAPSGATATSGSATIPPSYYALTETTTNQYTRLPVTLPAPATVVAFYSTSNLDMYGWPDSVDVIPAGPGAQVMQLTYFDSTGAGPFAVQKKLNGKFPAVVALHAGSIDVAVIAECFVFETGAFENSVGQITLCALEAPLPAIPSSVIPADFPGFTDIAQLTITRPLVYLPPSYFALAQQQNSAPQLEGDFLVKQGSPTVLTPVSQIGVLAGTNIIEFTAQPDVQYEIASVSATFIKLTTAYTGLSHPQIAPGAETHHEFANHRPAQSVSEEADAVVSAAFLVSPSQATPPDDAQLQTLLAEFTLPQSTAPALTYIDESGGPFMVGETVKGQKSGGSAVVLYDDQGVNNTGVLAFNPGSVKNGFVESEIVTGQTSGATATVVVPRTLASNPLPTKLSGLYARTLSLVLGAPVVSQPITLI